MLLFWGEKKTHPNPLGEFPIEQSCSPACLCLSSASPWLWILLSGPDQIRVQKLFTHLLVERGYSNPLQPHYMYSGAVDDISTLLLI